MSEGRDSIAEGGGFPAAALLQRDDILRFLAQQRWFGEKSDVPSDVRVAALIPLPWGGGVFAIALVTVVVGGRDESYQLPLAARAVAAKNLPARAIIASGDVQGRPTTVFDAVEDPEFRRGLADALAGGAIAEAGDGLRWIAEAESEARLVVPEQAEIRVVAAEQSNTSIVFDREAIFKLFRKLESGIHPDIEVSRFLTTRVRFPHTPVVLGTVRIEQRGSQTAAGLLQEYLHGSIDAWSYALDRARPYFAAPASADPHRQDVINAFLDDGRRLGAVTRQMHDALAGDSAHPAFAPEPATPTDLDRWAQRAQQMIRDALGALERQLNAPTIPNDRLAEAKALVQRRERYLDWVHELTDDLGGDLGVRIRVHGDYHLGQILRTASGDFVVIDFEGEPTRSLAQRREKTSPLRDVAAMLRSFGYAAAALAKSLERSADMATRELRAGRWERDVRAAFLEGYLKQSSETPRILPDEESHIRRLIALFETEKAFYELTYELDHRPDWAWIPMRGIAKLLASNVGA